MVHNAKTNNLKENTSGENDTGRGIADSEMKVMRVLKDKKEHCGAEAKQRIHKVNTNLPNSKNYYTKRS